MFTSSLSSDRYHPVRFEYCPTRGRGGIRRCNQATNHAATKMISPLLFPPRLLPSLPLTIKATTPPIPSQRSLSKPGRPRQKTNRGAPFPEHPLFPDSLPNEDAKK